MVVRDPQFPEVDVLERRRRELGMSRAAIARRSGVSLPTVNRIFGGRAGQASLVNIKAVARALGVSVRFEPVGSSAEFREREALGRARKIVALVQGTSALEEQAVDEETREAFVRQTVHDLMAGSPRRLWTTK
jgi:transcriptional regulator with XRE-family HTH domain